MIIFFLERGVDSKGISIVPWLDVIASRSFYAVLTRRTHEGGVLLSRERASCFCIRRTQGRYLAGKGRVCVTMSLFQKRAGEKGIEKRRGGVCG